MRESKTNNFTEEQLEALTSFIEETVEKRTLHNILRQLSNQIDSIIGRSSRFTTEEELKLLLQSDLFKVPEISEDISDYAVSAYESNQMNYES